MPLPLTASSTLTSRFQTTIPELVRKTLGLGKQDKLEYVISEKGVVTIKKSEASGNTDPALLPFLSLLERDIRENPQSIRTISAQELSKTEQLLAGVEVDLDEPL